MRWAHLVWIGLAIARIADANPTEAQAKYREAARLAAADDNEKALALVDEGLASAPKDLQLLELRGNLLLKMRDYEGALSAYQTYIDAGATGANKRAAQKIVAGLGAVKSSFVEITLANGPGTVYLDSKSQGVFCTAQPTCKKNTLPGDYKVIVERPGFERWTGRVTVQNKQTASVAVTLVEKPSAVTVAVAQPGAKVAIDGKDVPATLGGGDHELVVTLDHFATERRTISAHEGKPLAIEISLVPLVPIAVSVPAAALTLDDKPLAIEQGGVAIPAGEHVLVARAAGFHDARVPIPAERGADWKLDVALPPIGAMIDVAGAPAGSKLLVDGKAVGTAPLAAPVEVPPGVHDVEVQADGYLPYRDHGSFAGSQQVRVRISHLRPASRRRTYLAAAGTGVAMVIGGVTSYLALDRRNAYDARARLAGITVDDPTLQSLETSGKRFAIAADVGFGLAMVGVAATTYFFLREGRGESEGSVQVGIGLGTAMVSGRF